MFYNCSSIKKKEFDCDDLIQIDSTFYYLNKIKNEDFDSKSELTKSNNQIIIPNQDFIFKDNLTEEKFIEYSIIGKNQKRQLTLILGQDYNQNYYFIWNQTTNKIDTLSGKPYFFNDKMVSIEDPYTDFPETIEIWNVLKNNNIELKNKFAIRKCKEFSNLESYLSANYLFIKSGFDNKNSKYFKIKIE